MRPDVAIIGAGYVGMPLARVFADAGKTVVLIDVDQNIVDGVNRGESHIDDVPSGELKKLVDADRVTATADYDAPKVVGGLTPACTERASELYRSAVETVVPVSSPEAAELTKLLENIFRAVNIALVNELAQLCERMD